MASNLFVCGTDRLAGASVIVLGLLGSLAKVVGRVGFLRPVGEAGGQDRDAGLVRAAYNLPLEMSQICPLSVTQARELVAHGRQQELVQRINQAYGRVAEGNEVVVVEGIDYRRATSLFDLDLNAVVAEQLEASVLLVAGGTEADRPEPRDDLVTTLVLARHSFEQKNCRVLGVVVNKVPPEKVEQIASELDAALRAEGLTLFGVVPFINLLAMPRLRQIADRLEARVLLGERYLDNLVARTITAAMAPRNMLRYLQTDRTLVVTPGDRDDAILAAMCSHLSATHPSIAGIILTGGLQPSEAIMKLATGLSDVRLPMLSVKQDTYTATAQITSMEVRIQPGDSEKINAAIEAVGRCVRQDRLWDVLKLPRPRRPSPQDFLDRLIAQARSYNKHIVFPEGDEPRTLQAVGRIRRLGLVRATLLGNVEQIRRQADQLGVDLDEVRLIDPARSQRADHYAEVFYELRRHKRSINLDAARDQIQTSNTYFGTMMVYLGEADGLVSGAVHSTADTIRPALQIIRARPDIGLASSVFFMAFRDRVVVYGDCAIVLDPNPQELASIAIASAQTARAFGIEPCVAMLSYSTGASAAGGSVEKVRQATEIVRSKNPDFVVDGPVQYDAAVDPTVARIKRPDSPLGGRATVFIFPDLDAGNIAYKAVQRSAGAVAVGPILQGLNKPVNDLSRGCSVDDIVYVAAITAIQAQKL